MNLIHDLNNLENLSIKEKIQRMLVKLAMKGKILVGGSLTLRTESSGGGLERNSKNIANQKIIEQSLLENEKTDKPICHQLF